MALRVVHIDKKRLKVDADAMALWEEVLKPKWEEQARRMVEEVRADLKAGKGLKPEKYSDKRKPTQKK